MGRNMVIFGTVLSNSQHSNNKTQNVLVLGRDFVKKINGTTIYAEKMYSPNFSVEIESFVLRQHYRGDDSYLVVNGKQVTQFKAKDSEIKARQLTLGSISTRDTLLVSDTEDSKLYGNIYDFSFDKILDIHNYLTKKKQYKMFGFIKKALAVMTSFFNLSYVNSLDCVSMTNQECKARSEIMLILMSLFFTHIVLK